MYIHVVKSGDSLYSIARSHGVSLDSIKQANDLTYPNRLTIGQAIIVPGSSNLQDKREIVVNGFCYTNITNQTLQNTLPYLTYISIFSYQVNYNGKLTPLDDTRIIEEAKKQRVASIMAVTNFLNSRFDSDLANIILTDEGVQTALINNLLEILRQKGFMGVCIDFEYIYPKDRQNYNAFLEKISNVMHKEGYILLTAIAPKISENQQGLLYEAHDYEAHGKYADYVIIMTYEWGYTYGPPMAVSPINQVKKVLDYAISALPSKKILMGMPNYGYDWKLPYKKGTAASPITNTNAQNRATNVGAKIQYDSTSEAPFYNYYDNNGIMHVVWFDDARSIMARLKLVDNYNLGGVSYWTLNNYFKPNWYVLNSMYSVKKVL